MLFTALTALLASGAIAITSQFNRGRYFLIYRAKALFVFAAITVFSLSGYFTLRQYEVWANDPFSKFLLPPYQTLQYFLSYSLINFFLPYLISLAVAVLFLKAAEILNQRFQERFFEKEEPYLGAVSLFLTGHPGWLIYSLCLLGLYLFWHLGHRLFKAKRERLSLYKLWGPVAFFVILILVLI